MRRSGAIRLRGPRDNVYGVFFLAAIVVSPAGFFAIARGGLIVPAGASDSHETERGAEGERMGGSEPGPGASSR